tara:strand:- start:198 stop:299 length:102 start_codon:yes stop_codon:yes gene_type:complete
LGGLADSFEQALNKTFEGKRMRREWFIWNQNDI